MLQVGKRKRKDLKAPSDAHITEARERAEEDEEESKGEARVKSARNASRAGGADGQTVFIDTGKRK